VGQWSLARDRWRAGRGGSTRGGRAAAGGLVCTAAETVSPPGSPRLLGSEPPPAHPHALRAFSRPASPSPPWSCGYAQRASAPCTWAKASVPSRTYAPSAPRCCAHGREWEGRSVERATRPTPPSSMAAPSLTPPRPCLRGFQATQSSRMSGHTGMPVCAAVGGPVSAASLTRTLRGWTAPALRWAARRCSGPPSARQRARTDAAPCLTSSPPEGHSGKHRRRCALPVP